MQKIRIMEFFIENMLHWQSEVRLLLFTVCTCGVNYKRNRTETTYMVWPCSKNGRGTIVQDSIEVDTKAEESMRETKEKLDGRNKEGHE